MFRIIGLILFFEALPYREFVRAYISIENMNVCLFSIDIYALPSHDGQKSRDL
jgi:hypothetical protein